MRIFERISVMKSIYVGWDDEKGAWLCRLEHDNGSQENHHFPDSVTLGQAIEEACHCLDLPQTPEDFAIEPRAEGGYAMWMPTPGEETVEEPIIIPELQARMMEAGLGLVADDFAYHASDLYIVAKPGVREWLAANLKHPRNVTTFRSQEGSGWNGAGKLCFEVSFMGLWKKHKDKPRLSARYTWEGEPVRLGPWVVVDYGNNLLKHGTREECNAYAEALDKDGIETIVKEVTD
jgi:hypothetical protein